MQTPCAPAMMTGMEHTTGAKEVTKRYIVEAWRGMECIAFRRVARPATVASTAWNYIVDKGADRLYVRFDGDIHGMAATWQATGGWVRIDDAALEAVLQEVAL